ncbi:MAG: sensor histidine kinase, partial [Terriglobales bacterium]
VEDTEHKLEKGVENVGTLDGMLWKISQTCSALVVYGTTRNAKASSQFDQLLNQIREDASQLKTAMNEDPERRDDAREIARTFDECIDKLRSYKSELDNNGMLGLGELRQFLQPQGIPILKQVHVFVEHEQERNRKELPKRAREYRDQMKVSVAVLVLFNIIMAIVLLRLFTKEITQKIDLLTDNTMRLRYGQPLNPELKGADELSNLDRVFHSMAQAVDDAKKMQEQALETIRTSEERVRTLIENMTVGLITVDQNGAVQSLNPRMEQMFNSESAQLKGRNIVELFQENGAMEPQQLLSMLQKKAGAGQSVELTARRPNGELFPVEVAVSEIRYGEETVVLANVQDVSARHEIERMKREFVAMVSHDLRTPLTSIRGTITLVQNGACGEIADEASELLEEADTELVRLTKLINDLLDIARIEAGKYQLDVQTVKLAPVMKHSVAAVANLAQSANVKLDLAATDASVRADSARIV